MCGICGVVDLSGRQRADVLLVRQMCDRIRHRGPDGDGYFAAPSVALGMRRLSIIDVDGSDQPLYNEDHTIALVFNGEIYNYRELRADLVRAGHRLRTDGDGETLIHLYEQHGLDLFKHLRGMYAFALWDANANRLVLAVDHIGMKPLYLLEQDGRLLFASEVKALFADEAAPRALNLDVLDTYLSFGYPLGEETLFAGIRRLPPGHALVAEGGATRLVRHWDFPKPSPLTETAAHDEDTLIEAARGRLSEAVHLHLRSDVPLGLFLSGGIDSAAVLALMAQEVSGSIKTFTVGYDADTPDNELLHARRIARHFETEHHERVIDAEDWWNGFNEYVYYHDEPNANPSAVSLLLLSELTGAQVKVVLTGLGGDELFGGYIHHRAIPQLIQRQRIVGTPYMASAARGVAAALGRLEPYYPALKRYRYIGALPTYLPRLRQALLPREDGLLRMQSYDGMVFSDSLRARLYGADLLASWTRAHHKEQTYADILQRSWRDDPYNTAQALVINTWLTGNALLSQDKTAMAHSLEARVPFFDPALLRFAANVPPSIRMKSNKYVLRAALRPLLPAFALERPKQPFGTPILHWFGGALAGRIGEVLLDDGAFIRDLFQREALESLLRAHFDGRENQVEVIFRLLTLELWARRFGIGNAVWLAAR
jgi:asparagine synthase (glutamine-hydrolysing)